MGSLILCHDQHAAHPYEITRIHCKIFTMEELCYYLCNNLYLIDYTIMNEQLCGWLEEDIGKRELADQLRDVIRMRGSVEKFVLTILKSSGIYKEAEMIRIQNVLERLKNQKDIERQKYKGDNLLESGEVEEAILVTEDGEIYKKQPHNGTVVNSVGAGDSMVAGFLAGYLNTGSYERALELGTAAGSATAFQSWLASREDIVKLLDRPYSEYQI